MKIATALSAALLALLAGCSSTGAGEGFWQAHVTASGLEANRPKSLRALGQAADLVVVGRVVGYAEGRDYTSPGKPANRTGNLTIAIETSSPKVEATEVRVEFSRPPLVSAEQAARDLPTQTVVFFLSDGYVDGHGPVYGCTSPSLCVIGITDGDLDTKREPEAAIDLAHERGKGGYRSVQDVLSEARPG